MKLVINTCHGGFSLSAKAIELGKQLAPECDWDTYSYPARNHPALIHVVETLGEAANGMCAELTIVDIPKGEHYEIAEYDGLESVRIIRLDDFPVAT